ncbi:MAG: alpha/beta hydrolase [Sphingomonas sp.]
MADPLFTPSGVRLRRHSARAGDLNWLLLPGGPGIGSESLDELAAALGVSGTIWLVDLPGDGSNRTPPGASADPFSRWPQVVAEAARALPNVVFAGHSTGGMYLLATPELERHILGLVLLDTAPDAGWHARFVEMTARNPLPAVEAAAAIYERDRRDENIAAVAVASAEWNFTSEAVAAGRELLARMPYNSAAVDWSEANFDHVYEAAWWPESIPVLVLAGADDRIVWQGGWEDDRFHTSGALFRSIPRAGHFPWIENPAAVGAAFAEIAGRIAAT